MAKLKVGLPGLIVLNPKVTFDMHVPGVVEGKRCDKATARWGSVGQIDHQRCGSLARSVIREGSGEVREPFCACQGIPRDHESWLDCGKAANTNKRLLMIVAMAVMGSPFGLGTPRIFLN